MSWPIKFAALLLFFAVLGLAAVVLNVVLIAVGHWLRDRFRRA